MAASRISRLQDHLGFWLRMVSNEVSLEFARALKSRDVGVAEWVMLRELYEREESAIGALGEVTGMTKGAVSKVVDRLLAKKWVHCEESSQDGRARRLRLSPEGERLVPILSKLADRNDEKYFSVLNGSERRELRKILEKMASEHGLDVFPIA